MEKNNRRNLLFGLLLTGVVSLPALITVVGDSRKPSFSPENAWYWLALCCLPVLGFILSVIGLLRGIHWGHFAWSQSILSFLVMVAYVGWYRRELDFVKMGPDPDAIDKSPPMASSTGLLLVVVLWLVPGFLPLVVARFWKWHKARRG
jgi:hypothetical protein